MCRTVDALTSYCENPLHDRSSKCHCVINTAYCFNIIYNTSGICWKHGGVDFSSCHCIDQGTLTTLGIFGHQFFYFDIRDSGSQFFHSGNTIRLIVLNADTTLCIWKKSDYDFQSFHNLLRLIHHAPVITCKIGLTFCTVHQYVFNLVRLLGGKLHMCGEACTTKTYYTAIANPSDNLLTGKRSRICRVEFHLFIQSVILHYNGIYHTSGSCQTFLDAFHRTGYRSMNRGRYKSACFCDHLACKHVVPLCNHRLRRSTNVLGQWIRQICLREIFLHRAVL